MKRPAESSPTHVQKTADVTHSPRRQRATTPGGHLAQLSAMLNSSPRAQSLGEMKDGIQSSQQVQHLADLTAATNQGMPAQLGGIEASDQPSPENAGGAIDAKTFPVQRRAVAGEADDGFLAASNDSAQLKPDASSTQSQMAAAPHGLAEDSQSSDRPSNRTGLPDRLKSGVEHLSGISLDHVRVHYNSPQPRQLHADAFARGSQIHVAPGKEQHLPHEAWHVVQQAQGRVQPTMQMKNGVAVNDNQGLEHEADVMGAKALASAAPALPGGLSDPLLPAGHAMVAQSHGAVVQRHLAGDLNSGKFNVAIAGEVHDEIPEEQERQLWSDYGITLHYEADSIPLGGPSAGAVTPDPLILRIGFAWKALTDHLQTYLAQAQKPGQLVSPESAADAKWVLNYLIPTLRNDLVRVAEKSKGASDASLLEEVGTQLKEVAPLLKKRGKLDELETRIMSSKLRRDFPAIESKIQALHLGSEFKGVDFAQVPLRVARSQQMLAQIDKVSASLRNTIYKVGDRHVGDIKREGWQPKGKVGVYDRTQYGAEMTAVLSEESARAATPAKGPSGSVPPPSSAGPPVASGPKPPAKPPALASGQSGPKPPVEPPKVQPSPQPAPPGSSSKAPAKPPASASGKSGPKPPVEPPKVQPSPQPAPASSSSKPSAKPPASSARVEPEKPVAQPPKAKAPRPASKPKAPPAPVKSAEDVKLDQVQHLLNVARSTSGTAKGFIAIEAALGQRDRRSASGVISAIQEILQAREERWAITKWAVRSKETQDLYNAIEAVL